MNIDIKRASIADLEEIQKIGRLTFYETFADGNTAEDMQKYLDESFATEKVRNELNNSESEFYFAQFNEKVIGYLKINYGEAQTEHKVNNAMEIERIYVCKAFQGMKIGGLLYQKAIETAKRLKTDNVWLGVWENNPKAIKFYSKLGFEVFDKHVFVLGTDVQTDLLMKLEIK